MKPLPPRHRCPTCNVDHYDDDGIAKINKHHSTCVECGEVCGENYMVEPEVWRTAKMDYHDGVLHLACLEKRIGRPLTISDFPKKPPNNTSIFFAYRMGAVSG